MKQSLIDFYTSLPLVIQITLLFALFFGVVITFLIFRLFYLKVKWNNRSLKNNRVEEGMNQILSDYLFHGQPNTADAGTKSLWLTLSKLKEYPLSNSETRNIIVNLLIRFKQTFSGEFSDRIQKLYEELGLKERAITAISKGAKMEKLYALNELYQMDIAVDNSLVLPLLKHQDKLVRKYARCFLVKKENSASFDFLNEVTDTLLPWEQYELHGVLAKKNYLDVPLFAQWISEDFHPSVILFSIRMAFQFKQDDAIPVIISILGNPNKQVRKEAINALGKFKAHLAEPALIKMYENEEADVKIEILKALGIIDSGLSLDFLTQQFEKEMHVEVKKHAFRSILNQRKRAGKLIDDLLLRSVGINKKVIQQTMNPLIRY
jgi:hypothetical protein